MTEHNLPLPPLRVPRECAAFAGEGGGGVRDKVVILDPVGASWAMVGVDNHRVHPGVRRR